MWGGLFGAAPFTLDASFPIFRHELVGKGARSLKVPPVTGYLVGSAEMVLAIYFLAIA
jgi:hypothetical protein